MRLVTRGDLDGVTSAVLLSTMEKIDSIELIHPQDITDKKFSITGNDIMANLPYHPDCAMWFDHHELTDSNEKPPVSYKGRHAIAPSVSRVIYDYYNSEALKKYEQIVNETDRLDSADLEPGDVTDPKGVILLGFTVDSRTGMGSFKEYFSSLVTWLKAMPPEDVLKQPEVMTRTQRMKEANAEFLSLLKDHSRKDGSVVVTDFRPLEKIPVGNRFLVYTIFPDVNVSLRLQWGPEKKFVAATLGHNIFKRDCKTNIGHLCSRYGGGGHRGAGACVLVPAEADRQVGEMIEELKRNG
ncbi:MAG: exopolyphosphatase [Nitrospirota bacterium]|nr:exopolyphosphatase [Nitrospirota bacterium]